MTTTLIRLIRESFSHAEAQRFAAFAPRTEQENAALQFAQEVLLIFKPRPGACLLMSALLCSRLKISLNVPAYVVAGFLKVGNATIFGSERASPDPSAFSAPTLAWDGHAWVQFGDRLIDLSISRTADSIKSHPVLIDYFRGKRRGALAGTYEAFARDGITYGPQYVLTDPQVEPLAGAAMAFAQGRIDLPQ